MSRSSNMNAGGVLASQRESESLFRAMADSAPVLLWMAGTDALCFFFNKTWLEFTGRPMEEQIGNQWAEHVHAEDFQECMDIYMTNFVNRSSFRMEYRIRRADGQYRWVLDQGVPRFGLRGDFEGYIGSCIDITDFKEANEALVKMSQRLQAKTDAMSRLLSEKEVLLKEVHHRVKNNLQIVSSLLNIQGHQVAGARDAELFRNTQNRIHAIALVHDKLYRSKDLAQMNLGEYFEELVHSLNEMFATHARRITATVNADKVYVNMDVAMSSGLIVNELVTNCFRHAFPNRDRGTVRIDLRCRDEVGCELAVTDDGIGFPEALDFRQTKSLGMQLVCTLVDQLNATIALDRRSGTRFAVDFSSELAR